MKCKYKLAQIILIIISIKLVEEKTGEIGNTVMKHIFTIGCQRSYSGQNKNKNCTKVNKSEK